MFTFIIALVIVLFGSSSSILKENQSSRFESSRYAGFFISLDKYPDDNASEIGLHLTERFPDNLTTWRAVKGLCGNGVSLQSVAHSLFYIRAVGSNVSASRFQDSKEYRDEVCFSSGIFKDAINMIVFQPFLQPSKYLGITPNKDYKAVLKPSVFVRIFNNRPLSIVRLIRSMASLVTWKAKVNAIEETKGNCVNSNGNWSEWEPWSDCSLSCGTQGFRTRRRKCIGTVPNIGTTDTCTIELDVKIEACNIKICPTRSDYYLSYWRCFFYPPTHGGWSSWTTHSTCNQCEGGLKYSSRKCDHPKPVHCGFVCGGNSFQAEMCPINGGWTSWLQWSTCTVTCGGGTKTRTRSCINPIPQYDGIFCKDAQEETRVCNTRLCPINGGWTSWSQWSKCTVTCGGGTKTRTRSCTNPTPQYGGTACQNSNEETTVCNSDHCPINGGYTSWSSWSTCLVSCGGGKNFRTRLCANPTPKYGGADCEEKAYEEKACNLQPCPTCKSGWKENGANNKCYFYNNQLKSWSDAEAYCVAQGGHLTSIGNLHENNFVSGTYPGTPHVWIGLNDHSNEGTYVWTNGASNVYRNFKDGEPNNGKQDNGEPGNGEEECVQIYEGGSTWNDENCELRYAFVCKGAKTY